MTSASELTRDLMVRFHRAFTDHRPDDLDDLIGEGCMLENTTPAPDGARYAGREACLEFWKGIASASGLRFEAEEIWASGDRGLIRWKLRWGRGRQTGSAGSTSCACVMAGSWRVWAM